MTHHEAIDWLYRARVRGMKLGLENTRRLLAALGDPAASFRSIHVAGTNGKGSVCAMADAILRAGGRRTGLYTSPHLVRFEERIRVNGIPAGTGAIADGLNRIRKLTRGWDPEPTFFEIATALALDHFRNAGVEVAVLETGLGGRLDSTNAVIPAVSVLTPIGFDHQSWLGNTIGEIAREKAGILKPGVPAVSSPQPAAARSVIDAVAAVAAVDVAYVESPDTRHEISLPGEHQKWNAAVAVRALDAGRFAPAEEAIRDGLGSVSWPGRFQLVSPRLVLDGAHNPQAAATVVETWRQRFPGQMAAVVIGVLRDKDAASLARILAPITACFFPVTIASDRALPAGELAAILSAAMRDIPVSACAGFAAGLAAAQATPHPVLVTGSLFLVGEAIASMMSPAPTPMENERLTQQTSPR